MPEAAIASSHFEPDGYGDARKFLINYYQESNGGDPQRQTRLVNTPGSRLIDNGTVLTSGVRGVFQADGFASGKIVVADGATLRLFDASAVSWGALTGSITGTDRVKAVFGEVQAGFLANGNLFQSDGVSVAALSDADWGTLLSDAGAAAFTSIATIGQRLLASYGSRFGFSTTLQFNTTTTLSYYTAEYAPDGIVGLAVLNNTLLVFGTSTIQPWIETGNNDDPFSPIVGQEIDRGCMARDTIVKMDNGIAFVGDDRVPYIMRGLNLQRLNQNDPWVTRVLKATSASDVVCSVIEDDGHSFYVIWTPSKCMVHDLATGTWHLRQSVDYIQREAVAFLNATLGDITLVATGALLIKGQLSATLGAVLLAATLEDTTIYASEGELNATLDAVTLVATVILTPIPVYTRDASTILTRAAATVKARH